MAVGFNTVMRFTGKKEDDLEETEGEIYIHDGYSDYTC